MNFVVEPSALKSDTLSVPGDKSISHRALMLGSIAVGRTRIHGFLAGEDCLATLTALRAMGVSIEQPAAAEVIVDGVGRHGLRAPEVPLHLGNSGTAMRLFAGMLAGQAFPTELLGDESLSRRPMGRVIKPLELMGAEIHSNEGNPPLQIKGRQLSSVFYRSPVASAQVKSAILLAGLYANGEVTVVEPAITRDHTERMLRSMGVELGIGESQVIMRGGQDLAGVDVRIPADLSSAAFVILATLLATDAEVKITGVGVNPSRTGVLDILQAMGADISLDNAQYYSEEPVADLTVRSSKLHGIDVDPDKVSLAIDEFPVLFVAAACAEGRTTFTGIGELRVKESDRIATMAEGLKVLGVAVDESPDGAVIHGSQFSGGSVRSHGDHRIAMAFAAGATIARMPVHIEGTDAVNTSFPGFVACLKSLGVNITEQQGSPSAAQL